MIVADEAQNFTFKELTTLITRVGENTKLIICGDFMQSDTMVEVASKRCLICLIVKSHNSMA